MALEGKAHSRSSVRPTFVLESGVRFKPSAPMDITYGNEVTRDYLRASGYLGPVAVVDGEASPAYGMKMSKADYDALTAAMGVGYLRQRVTILVAGRTSGVTPYNDEIRGACISDGHDAGTPNMVDVGAECLKCIYNGIDPFGDEDEEA